MKLLIRARLCGLGLLAAFALASCGAGTARNAQGPLSADGGSGDGSVDGPSSATDGATDGGNDAVWPAPEAGGDGAGTCGPVGAACSSKSQCCSDYCVSGACACNTTGFACVADDDCCDGLSCAGDVCGPATPACLADGTACTGNGACCSGGCVSTSSGAEVCCAPPQAACVGGNGVSGGCCPTLGASIPCTNGTCCIPLGGQDGQCVSATDCCGTGAFCVDYGIIGRICCAQTAVSETHGQPCDQNSDCCSESCTNKVCD